MMLGIRNIPLSFVRSQLITRRNNSMSKKLLFPLIKSLHPDMFAQETQQIQATNKECVQNINSLWDCVDTLVESLLSVQKNGGNSLDIRNPFRETYDVSCFVRNVQVSTASDSTTHHPPATIVKKVYTIKVSAALCKKGTLAVDEAKLEVNRIFQQQGQMFLAVGLPNPWAGLSGPKTSSGKRANRMYTRPGNDEEVSASELTELEVAMFERAETVNARHRRRVRHSTGQLTELFGEARKSNSRYFTNSNATNSWQKKLELRAAVSEIDAYLCSGKVVVSGLPLEEEYAAMARLRQVLLDYGPTVNFSLAAYSRVFFVVGEKHAKKKTRKVKQAGHGGGAAEDEGEGAEHVVPNTVDMGVTVARTGSFGPDGNGFGHEEIGSDRPGATRLHSTFVVRVPANYKVGPLLEYLRVNLPAASEFHEW